MNKYNFELKDGNIINFSMGMGIKEIYPPIENLKVTPTKKKQVFNHEYSYGYDNVTVEPIPEEYIIPDGTLNINENKTYDVTEYKRVSASVYPAPYLQNKEATPTKEEQNITYDDGYDGLGSVKVKAIGDEYIIPSGILEITTNGTHNVTEYESTNVNVTEKQLGTKYITKNGIYNAEDDGLDGYSIISVSVGEQTPTTDEECEKQITSILNKYMGYLYYEKPKTYPSDTDEQITLYTPDEQYTSYIIRNSGGYQAVWFKPTILWSYNGSSLTTYRKTLPASSVLDTYPLPDDVFSATWDKMNASGALGYMSSAYSTIEQCIEAMKDPTTEYTSTGSTLWSCGNTPSGYFAQYSNMTCINGYTCKRISSNEKIEVIPTT